MRVLPGVSSVSIASVLPRRGAIDQTVEVEGQTQPAGAQAAKIATVAIGARFFQTLALTMERGREFSEWDARLDAAGAIVSSRFAELLLSDRDPIGTRIRLVPANSTAAASRWLTIIGVAPQVQHRQEREPVVYLPFDSLPPSTASVLLRTEGDAATVTTGLRETLRKLDPNLPVYRVLTMSQVMDEATWNGRVASRVVRIITTIAFLFCVVGLYAVTARSVAQRTGEIGVRMAVGARPLHVALLIVKRTAVQVVAGLLAGIAGTFAWQSMFGQPNAPPAATPNVLVPIALLLAVATLAACWAPAQRAIRVDPAQALRSE
jgi:putative ABC transport system permease protein